jgi:polyhydroxyalkanoate synthase
MLTGRAARGTTWQVIDEWVARWSTEVVTPPAKKAVRKSPSKKVPAKKAPARKAAAPKPEASVDTIGSNPTRRYGSTGSRALGQR